MHYAKEGVGSVYEHNTDVAYQYLPKSNAALFLLSVDQPGSKAELYFLKDVREYSNIIGNRKRHEP